MTRSLIPVLVLVGLFAVAGCGDDDDPVQVESPPDVDTYDVLSGQPLRNRFFRLTSDFETDRIPMAAIDLQSVKVFRKVTEAGDIRADDVANVAAFADVTGDWVGNDFTATPAVYGARWREIELNLDVTDPGSSLLVDENAIFWCIDFGESLGENVELACTFEYFTSPTDKLRVGDDINDPPAGVIFDQGQQVPGEWYRFKLLKASTWTMNPWSHHLTVQQVYALGGRNLAPDLFDMRIERLDGTGDDPDLDENGVPYLQIFGLDAGAMDGTGERDGRPDLLAGALFDLARGLLVFPESFARPFAAEQAQYEANAAGTAFVWEESLYLVNHPVPDLYEVRDPSDFVWSSYFRLVMEHTPPAAD